MSINQPGGEGGDVGAGPSAELEGTAVGLNEFVGLADEVQASGVNATAAVDVINNLGPSYWDNYIGDEKTAAMAFWRVISVAISDGDIEPRELAQALTWVEETHGITSVTYAFIAGGLLAAGFALWGLNHGHKGVGPSPAPAPAAPPAVQITEPVPEPTTIGGEIVANIQKKLTLTKITVPGLSATQARGVSLAIAAAYKDLLYIDVNSLNHTEGLWRQVAAEMAVIDAKVEALRGGTSGVPPSVTDALKTIDAHLTQIDQSMNQASANINLLRNAVVGIQQQVSTLAGEVAALPAPSAPLTGTQLAELATIPALTAGLATATATATSAEALAAADASQLAAIGQSVPPTTLQDLEDCCEQNAQVTGPIRQGALSLGNFASLTSLGNLFHYLFEFTIIGALVDGILAILDLPDTVNGTVQGAEIVAGWAAKSAAVVLADISWSDAVHGGAVA